MEKVSMRGKSYPKGINSLFLITTSERRVFSSEAFPLWAEVLKQLNVFRLLATFAGSGIVCGILLIYTLKT
jgi:hypothetical protein